MKLPANTALFVVLLTASVAGSFAATARAAAVSDASLEAVIRAVVDTSLSPGVAVAVVRPGAPNWSIGLGHADREARRPVSPTTRFYIASTTKALTALAALQVAQRGALDLDAPLSRALPAARFSNGLSGDSIQVRDLLTHTHGIDPDGPISILISYTGDYDNRKIIDLIGSCGPASTGRAFRYSNLGYDLIGILLAPGTTRGCREVVDREVLGPAGMLHTTAYRSRVPARETAMPYELGPNGLERVPLGKQDVNMAGGHFSTASDLARLVAIELNHGRLEGKQIFPAEVIDRSQRSQAVQDRDDGPFHRFGWGFGWDLATYDGDTVLARPGSFNGYFSHISFMPRHGVGVVILANGGDAASLMAHLVATAVYDHLLGKPDAEARLRSGIEELRGRLARAHEMIAGERARRASRAAPLPLDLGAYAGSYVSPVYGALELTMQGGALRARMGVAESAVEVYNASKNQLRFELFGGGDVLTAVVPAGAQHPTEIRMLNTTFTRR